MIYECTPNGYDNYTIDLDKVAYIEWKQIPKTDDLYCAVVHFNGGTPPLDLGEVMPGHAAQLKKAMNENKEK